MMNSTTLIQLDGGTRIKQGDVASKFKYQLCDETGTPIVLTGNATVKLIKENKKWTVECPVEDSTVTFQINAFLPIGTYELEIVAGDFVFPSDHSCRITVSKAEGVTTGTVEELKTINGVVKETIQKMGLNGLSDEERSALERAKQLRNYDDTGLKGKVASLEYDVNQLKAKPDFNPSTILSKITELESRLNEVGTDQGLVQQLEVLRRKVENWTDKDTVFDPTDLTNRIETLENRPTLNITPLEERLSQLEGNHTARDLETLTGRVRALEERPQGSSFDPSPILERVRNLESKPSYDDTSIRSDLNTLKSNVGSQEGRIAILEGREYNNATYDDSELRNEISGLKTKVGNLENQTYDDGELKARLSAVESTKTEIDSLKNDDAEIKRRLQEVEGRADRDTVYDDSQLVNRLVQLENYKRSSETEIRDIKNVNVTSANFSTKAEQAGLATKDFVSQAISKLPTGGEPRDTGWRDITTEMYAAMGESAGGVWQYRRIENQVQLMVSAVFVAGGKYKKWRISKREYDFPPQIKPTLPPFPQGPRIYTQIYSEPLFSYHNTSHKGSISITVDTGDPTRHNKLKLDPADDSFSNAIITYPCHTPWPSEPIGDKL